MRAFIITLLVILSVLILLIVVAGLVLFLFTMKRPKKQPNPMTVDDYSEHMNPFKKFIKGEKDWLFSKGYEEVEITSFDGLKLKGILVYADKPSKKTVLAIHGYKSCGINEYSSYARIYHELGYNMLIPDDRSHGISEGKYIGFAWHDRRDCIAWTKYILDKFGEDSSILLHGISMGSATVMNASGEADLPEQVKGVVSDCGYSCAWDVCKHVLKRNFHLPAFPFLHVANLFNMMLCGYSLKKSSSVNQLKQSKIPFLFIHGADDDFVPTRMVYEVYEACPSEVKDLYVFDGADHAESYYVCRDEYLKALYSFIEKIGF